MKAQLLLTLCLVSTLLLGTKSTSAQNGAWPGLNLGTLACPSTNNYAGSTAAASNDCSIDFSPDHIYQFTTTTVSTVTASLCGSGYDTKIYFYNITSGACSGGGLISNDDFCGTSSEVSQVSLAAGTYVVVVEGFSGASGNYSLTITLSSCGGGGYCTSGASSTADSDIDQVVLAGDINTINNNTASVCAGYTDFTGLTPAELSQGGSYTAAVTLGTCGGDFAKSGRIYIDWNQDNDFLDANEDLGSFGGSSTTATYNQPITVPAGATLGNTRMRVICQEGGVPASSCASFTYGETEDYTVTVVTGSPMAFSSVTSTQGVTSTVPACESNVQIIGVEVVTTGTTTPLFFTQLRMNMTGTNAIADVSNIDVFYTGTSNTFATTTSFGSATPAGGNFNVNGSQTLCTGTNYFWIAYDLAASPTVGNNLDAQCIRITVGGTNYTPSTTNPAGDRGIVTCLAPGGISSNLQSWLRADNGAGTTTNGTATGAWTDQSTSSNSASQGTGTESPLFRRTTATDVNFNPSLEFDGADDYMDLPANTIATGGAAYSIYTVAVPSGTHSTTNPGKIVMAGEYNLLSSTNLWVAIDIRPTMQVNQGFNQNDLITPNNMVGNDEPILIGAHYDFTDATRRETEIASTSGNFSSSDNPTVNHSNDGTINLIGKASPDNEFFDGLISEVIVYNGKHSVADREKVDTYLAMKYGLTLDHDYTSSTGLTLWDYSANTTHNNDIAGIGRDDNSGQDQRQSRSENADRVVTIGNSTAIAADNLANGNSFSADQSFLLWGNNNAALSGQWQLNPFMTLNGDEIESVMLREWKAVETGTIGTVTIRVDMSSVPGVGGTLGNNDLSQTVLLVDTDDDFLTGATSIAPSSFNNTTDIVEFQHNFVAGTGLFFTIGSLDYGTAPLPVELVDFQGQCENEYAKLHWTTASENNSHFFTVERSENGSDFYPVGQVDAAGHSTHTLHYTWEGQERLTEENYFRLSQTDVDFQRTTYETITLGCTQIEPNLSVWVDQTHVIVSAMQTEAGQSSIRIIDAQGRLVMTRPFWLNEGSNRIELPRQELAAGLYSVGVETTSGGTYQKLLIP